MTTAMSHDSPLSEADRFLLDQVRAGDQRAWAQLVERYEGRLTAFARARLRQQADAEDLVQETFLSFLRGLRAYRADASLETYLFTILRRKIIDVFRGRDVAVCSLSELAAAGRNDGSTFPLTPELPGSQPAGSWYVRREEDRSLDAAALAGAIKAIVDDAKHAPRFRDLQLMDMLFYAQLRNKDIAQRLEMTEQQVALFKHRWLKRVREKVELAISAGGRSSGDHDNDPPDTLLTAVWETHRFTCPKRSTIGAYLLGTLDPDWNGYIAFHLDPLGCRFCGANLADLETQAAQAEAQTFRQRIFESTVGFLKSR